MKLPAVSSFPVYLSGNQAGASGGNAKVVGDPSKCEDDCLPVKMRMYEWPGAHMVPDSSPEGSYTRGSGNILSYLTSF